MLKVGFDTGRAREFVDGVRAEVVDVIVVGEGVRKGEIVVVGRLSLAGFEINHLIKSEIGVVFVDKVVFKGGEFVGKEIMIMCSGFSICEQIAEVNVR